MIYKFINQDEEDKTEDEEEDKTEDEEGEKNEEDSCGCGPSDCDTCK